MSATAESLDGYRLRQVEIRAKELDEEKADKKDLNALALKMEKLEKALWSLLVGIVGSAVLVSLTLFATLGSHLS